MQTLYIQSSPSSVKYLETDTDSTVALLTETDGDVEEVISTANTLLLYQIKTTRQSSTRSEFSTVRDNIDRSGSTVVAAVTASTVIRGTDRDLTDVKSSEVNVQKVSSTVATVVNSFPEGST